MNCSPQGGLAGQNLVKDRTPWDQGKITRRKQQQRSSIVTASPICQPPLPRGVGEGRIEIKVEPGKKGNQDSGFSLILVLIALL